MAQRFDVSCPVLRPHLDFVHRMLWNILPLNSGVVPLPVVGLDQTRRAKLDPQYRWRDRQQRKFVSICISDPAARARPDEEAQVHIAE
jgi:hypothetical protein